MQVGGGGMSACTSLCSFCCFVLVVCFMDFCFTNVRILCRCVLIFPLSLFFQQPTISILSTFLKILPPFRDLSFSINLLFGPSHFYVIFGDIYYFFFPYA